jgi:hypothetical protein
VTYVPGEGGDDRLLAMLAEAIEAERAVPREFIEAGKRVFLPPDLDAELAMLVRDSEYELASTRSETAELHTLTFRSASVLIELAVGAEGLQGQLVPARHVRIEVELPDGVVGTATPDEVGHFTVRPMPAGRFRLRLRRDGENDVITTWITIA